MHHQRTLFPSILALAVGCGGAESPAVGTSSSAMQAVSSVSGATVYGSIFTVVSDTDDATYVELEDDVGHCLYNQHGFVRLNSGVCVHSLSGYVSAGWFELQTAGLDPTKDWRVDVRGTSVGGGGVEVYGFDPATNTYQHLDTLTFPSSYNPTTVVGSSALRAASGQLDIVVAKRESSMGRLVAVSEVILTDVTPPPPPPPPPPPVGLTVTFVDAPDSVVWGQGASASVRVDSVNAFEGPVELTFDTTRPSGPLGLTGQFSMPGFHLPAGGSLMVQLDLSTVQKGTRLGDLTYRVTAKGTHVATGAQVTRRRTERIEVFQTPGGFARIGGFQASGAQTCAPGLGLDPVTVSSNGRNSVVDAGGARRTYQNNARFSMHDCAFVALGTLSGHINFVSVGFPEEVTDRSQQIGPQGFSGVPGSNVAVEVWAAPDSSTLAVSWPQPGGLRGVKLCDVIRGSCGSPLTINDQLTSIVRNEDEVIVTYVQSGGGTRTRVQRI